MTAKQATNALVRTVHETYVTVTAQATIVLKLLGSTDPGMSLHWSGILVRIEHAALAQRQPPCLTKRDMDGWDYITLVQISSVHEITPSLQELHQAPVSISNWTLLMGGRDPCMLQG